MNLPPNNLNVWAEKDDGTWHYCNYNDVDGWMIGVDVNPVDNPLGFIPVRWLTEEEYDKLIQ